MEQNQLTATISSIFSMLDDISSKLKISNLSPIKASNNNSLINHINRLRQNMSLLAKFNSFSYPDYYTNSESEDILSLLASIHNYLTVLSSSGFDKTAFKNILALNDDLVKYIRISKLIQESVNNKNSISIQNKKAQYELDNILNIKNEFELEISHAKSIIAKNSETNEKIINLVNQLKSEQTIASKKGSEINSILLKSNSALQNIGNISENLKTFDSQLTDILSRNKNYENRLLNLIKNSEVKVDGVIKKSDDIDNLERTITSQISNAKELTDKARAALNLAGTYRLSRHFKNAYKLANSNRKFWAWVSLASALTCISFIIYILVEMNNVSNTEGSHLLMLFIARFSIIPILIGFFAFSAVQYVKQNNITEDYAHKKLLSETLISFKQEIDENNTDKASEFMDSILKTVLTPPINTNDKKNHKIEIDGINSLINTTNQINREILDRVIPSSEKGGGKEEKK